MSQTEKRPLSGLARAGLYLLFFALAFNRYWFHTVIFRDALLFFSPYKSLIADALHRRALDLWNPWMFMGLPLAGEFQAGIWYPLNLVFAGLPFGVAHRVFILLHYPIAAWNMDLFLRRRGVSGTAAMWGALVFACSGYLISQHAPVRMVLGAAWAPLAICYFDRALEGRFYAAAAGAVIGLMVIATDPETAVTAAGTGAVLVLWRAWQERRFLAGALAVGIAAATTFACSAVQSIPAAEMLRLTDRSGGLTLDAAKGFSLLPAQMLEFIWPSPYGSVWPNFTFWGHGLVERASDRNLPWSLTNYLGLPALALIVYALIAAKPRWKRYVAVAAVIFLALSLGKTLPFYGWLHHLPVFSAVRYPSKFVGWLVAALAVLSALGLDAAVLRLRQPGAWKLAAVYAGTVAAAAGVMAIVWPGVIARESALMEIPNLGSTATVEFWELFWRWVGLNAAVAAGLALAGWGRARRPALAALLALAVLDWWVFSLAGMPTGPKSMYEFRPFTANAIIADGGHSLGRYRIFQLPYRFYDQEPRLPVPKVERQAIWLRQALAPNLHVLPRLESMRGYSSYGFRTDGGMLEHAARRWLMEMYNVRYVVDQGEDGVKDGTTLVKENVEGIRVTRLKNTWPRAYFVARPLPARDDAEARELLASAWKQRTAVVEGVEGMVAGGTAGWVAAEVTRYEPDRVEVKVAAPSAGWLVLSDRYYPGWTARVDGRTEEIRRANAMVRAVPVAAGAHEVVFSYRPRSVWLGALVSGPAWLGLLGWAVARRRPRK